MSRENYAYTCGDCLKDIMQGESHLCQMGSGGASTPQYYQWPMTPVIAIDGETKRLLERIATALEKLAGVGL